ncbi:MAG: matrixin family metalloprotease [Myxococcales bacterium]|nr:matrixin family metalloprotease [Myxococcales bacterium]
MSKRAHLRAVIVLAVCALTVSVTSHARAFCRSTTCSADCPRDIEDCKTTGEKLFWPTMCVGFSLQEDASAHIEFAVFKDAALKSFVAWSDIECADGPATMAFQELASVACHQAEFNPTSANANIVLIQDNRWSYHSADNTLAKTTVTFDTKTGEIFDADIELNHAYNEFTVGEDVVIYDLQSILTHEIGHFIGLDHTPDYTATMNAAYEPSTIDLRTIAADDEAALCAAYPPDRDAKCIATPKGGLAYLCDGTEVPEEGCAIARGKLEPSVPLAGRRVGLGLALLAFLAQQSRRRRPRALTR